MAVLQLNNISKAFAGEYILNDISFTIDDRDKIGLIGSNGTGKTTLIKMILGEISSDESLSTKIKGNISFKSNIKIGYLSQNFDLNDNNTIYAEMLDVFKETLALGEKIKSINVELTLLIGEELDKKMKELAECSSIFEQNEGYSIDYKIRQVLLGLGIDERNYDKEIKYLSGGEKNRISLGKILLQEPDLLMLDEPTNHLDIKAIEWLENFLKSYKKSFLLISHDRYFLDNVINRVLEIEGKKIRSYVGNYTSFIIQKELIKRGEIKAYEKEQEKVKKMEEFIIRYKAGVKAKQARGREKLLNRMDLLENPDIKNDKIKLKFEVDTVSTDNVLSIKNLGKSYKNEIIFKNIDINIYRGNRISFIGKNGCGKSTFLKIIAKKLEKSEGEIVYGGKLNIGYYDQQHENLDKNATILEELRNNYPLSEEEARTLAGRFLFTSDDIFKVIGKLSGGEKARVSFIKLILDKPNVLILDEPTNHLDIYSKEILEEAISDYDGTILIVSHDRYFLDRISDKIYEITKNGLTSYKNIADYKIIDTSENSSNESKKEKVIDYEEQKRVKNRINSLEKRYIILEKEIDKLEVNKQNIEKNYELAGRKNDYEELIKLQNELDSADNIILEKMEEMENIELELEELKKFE
ncbi:MAG: ABC-F family ATP-binding cassette domain-containing protein [Fusobacteria bacterium]|nr:ABC-F family ATP-binding cassette domain-containing protein [Fusobacteriota bacterium]